MQFSLFDTIQSHIKDFESQLCTGIPAIVESYDPEENTVDATPALYRLDSDGVLAQYATLQRIPVQRVGTAEIAITYPLKQGDKVWLMVAHTDIEAWLTGEEDFVKPKTLKKHDINDCIAIPAVYKYANSPVKEGTENNLNIYYKDTSISVNEDGGVDITTSDSGKVSISNDSGELIDWISQLLSILETTTVNTVYGPSFLNSRTDITALRNELDTMKR